MNTDVLYKTTALELHPEQYHQMGKGLKPNAHAQM